MQLDDIIIDIDIETHDDFIDDPLKKSNDKSKLSCNNLIKKSNDKPKYDFSKISKGNGGIGMFYETQYKPYNRSEHFYNVISKFLNNDEPPLIENAKY